MFEWSYTAGWNLQSDTRNTFSSLAVCLSIHAMPQQPGPSSPAVPAVAPPPTALRRVFHAQASMRSQRGLGSITAVRRAVIDVIISI